MACSGWADGCTVSEASKVCFVRYASPAGVRYTSRRRSCRLRIQYSGTAPRAYARSSRCGRSRATCPPPRRRARPRTGGRRGSRRCCPARRPHRAPARRLPRGRAEAGCARQIRYGTHRAVLLPSCGRQSRAGSLGGSFQPVVRQSIPPVHRAGVPQSCPDARTPPGSTDMCGRLPLCVWGCAFGVFYFAFGLQMGPGPVA